MTTAQSSLYLVGQKTISNETQSYLCSLDQQISAIEKSDSMADYYFTLSTTPPAKQAVLPGSSLLSTGSSMEVPKAAVVNAVLEQDVLNSNDVKLVQRFYKAKSCNPDPERVFINPIYGFSDLKQRDQLLMKTIEELNEKTKQMCEMARQENAKSKLTSQQVEKIQQTKKAQKYQLIQIIKLIEKNAKVSGKYEIDEQAARENDLLLKQFDVFFKSGECDSELNVMTGFVRKLQTSRKFSEVTHACIDVGDNITSALNRILAQQKKRVQTVSDAVGSLGERVSSMEAAVNQHLQLQYNSRCVAGQATHL